MKSKYISFALFLLVLLSLWSCDNSDTKKIVGKWQLREYTFGNDITIKSDSVFYNFQKGSFSAICILEDSEYATFFGNYFLQDDKISIILLSDYHGPVYDKYIGWEDCQRIFNIDKLTSNSMILNYNDTLSVFRKY